MSEILIRAVEQQDHDQWVRLYRGYREFYELAPDDGVVERAWAWLRDPQVDLRGFVAVRGDRLVGLAHVQRILDPSTATTGIYLDDLFTDATERGAGVGRALLHRLAELAHAEAASVVRWITATDNARARRLYDSVAIATSWVTYDLTPDGE